MTVEELKLIEDYILDIPVIGEYDNENTPLDNFDAKCHDCEGGIKSIKEEMTDEQFMFLINTAEHIDRPTDMMMLIGEYFKEVI